MAYLVRMRTKFRAPALTLVLALALAASGCAPEAPRDGHTPTPSATPLFATDEEALTAAEEAYAAYQQVSDAILGGGGAEPERLLDVATEAQYEYEKAGFDEAQARQFRSTGTSKFDSMAVKERGVALDDGHAVLSVFVCDDYSSVDVVDSAGQSVVASDRPDRIPRVVFFHAGQSTKAQLVVSRIDEWDGDDFCL